MDLRNCPECGKVFAFIRTNLCSSCQQIDEENFKKVRMFIAKNPGEDIVTVSKETEVSENKIIRYLRDGKIAVATQDSNIRLECEVCGKLISTGRFCKDCSGRLSAGLKKSIENENRKTIGETLKPTGLRMHTSDIKDRED